MSYSTHLSHIAHQYICNMLKLNVHLQVGMICWHSAILDKLDDSWLRQGVEISTEQELDRLGSCLLVPRSEAVAKVLHDLTQLLHQHHALDQLHVTELRVPVNVRRTHQDWLGHILNSQIGPSSVLKIHCNLMIRGHPTLPAGLFRLKQCCQSNVVFCHHSVRDKSINFLSKPLETNRYLFSMSSCPLACSIANWLNSTNCSLTRTNLDVLQTHESEFCFTLIVTNNL